MRYLLLAIVIALGGLISACAPRTSVYKNWARQIEQLTRNDDTYGTVEDISLLLGVPPTRCEPVEAAVFKMGIGFDRRQEKPIVATLRRNGPIYQAGIRRGDIIKSVGGQPIVTAMQAGIAIRDIAQEGRPFEIETSRGTVSVVPKIPRTEQCYWAVYAGQVARRGSSAYVNQYGGSSSSGGAAYERFFRLSCRIEDGFVNECHANWQE